MVIESIDIEEFRAMHNVNLKLGKRITAIAGRNATMKSTVLGMLGQPFSISKGHPLFGCKSIDGYNYKSQYHDKFRFSDTHDIIGSHKWTLNLCNSNFYEKGYIKIKSIARKQKNKPDTIRFWNAESRAKGAGYIQLPVLFLSLSRLFPVGECNKTTSLDLDFSEEEIHWYVDWYKKILSIQDVSNPTLEVEKKDSKIIFAGISDEIHDIFTSSAGEGNIGRILLAIMSFKRLKEEYGKDYKAGILLIDELDATLYGFAQKQVVSFLYWAAKEYKIQIIFTTHSPLILKEVNNLQRDEIIRKGINQGNDAYKYECEIIDLYPRYSDEGVRMINGNNIHKATELTSVINSISLKGTIVNQNVNVYLEDLKAQSLVTFIFAKYFNIEIKNYIQYIDVNLAWSNYIQLHQKRIPEFRNSLIILDCDVQFLPDAKKAVKYIEEETENILFLPIDVEKGMFSFFRNHAIYNEFERILNSKEIILDYDSCYSQWVSEPKSTMEYKNWFRDFEKSIGNIALAYDFWCEKNSTMIQNFLREFIEAYNKIAENQELDYIIDPTQVDFMEESNDELD